MSKGNFVVDVEGGGVLTWSCQSPPWYCHVNECPTEEKQDGIWQGKGARVSRHLVSYLQTCKVYCKIGAM